MILIFDEEENTARVIIGSGTPATFNILTEDSDFLHTEASENLIQE